MPRPVLECPRRARELLADITVMFLNRYPWAQVTCLNAEVTVGLAAREATWSSDCESLCPLGPGPPSFRSVVITLQTVRFLVPRPVGRAQLPHLHTSSTPRTPQPSACSPDSWLFLGGGVLGGRRMLVLMYLPLGPPGAHVLLGLLCSKAFLGSTGPSFGSGVG